jgi:cysteine desulfurase
VRVFLDNAATTRMLPSVRAVCERWLDCGNPSSLYREGREAKAAIDEAREAVSESLGCEFPEVVFTASGTESATLAIVGAALGADATGRRKIVFGASEHHCVLNIHPLLERLGFQVEIVPVDAYARLQLDPLEQTLAGGDVLLLAAMHSNNEVGTFNPFGEIAQLCAKTGTLFFCDAVQSFGKVPLTVKNVGADLMSLSAHKIGGPKGVGALYVKPGTKLKPVISGGGQERELRGGTENVAAIAGFGEACLHISEVREDFAQELLFFLGSRGAIPTLREDLPRLPGHVHVRFPGISAETFLIALDRLGVSAGSGAACSSGSVEPSHVLMACGFSEDQSKEGLRFTLGKEITREEVNFAKSTISTLLERIDPSLATGT